MLAYKAFNKDLTCMGYQYTADGWNEEPEANCARNGFHCAENPLDCLFYYPSFKKARYWLVEAEGDIDEDAIDSKISCTRMRLVRELDLQDFVVEAVKYMLKHPGERKRYHNEHNGIDIRSGKHVKAKASVGTVLGLIEERNGVVLAAGVTTVRTSKMTYCIEGGRIVEKEDEAVGQKLEKRI